MFARQPHTFAHKIPQVYGAVILTFLIGRSLLGENQPNPTRYVTRFESQRTVEYQPRMRVVEQTVARPSWNPFRSGTRYEKRLVPIVSWVAREVEHRMPVTDRLAMHQNSSQDHRVGEKKNPRLVAQKEGWQTSGVKSIDRVPTRNFQTRPIVDSNIRETESAHSSNSANYGGVQRFDSDLPRIGMRSQVLR